MTASLLIKTCALAPSIVPDSLSAAPHACVIGTHICKVVLLRLQGGGLPTPYESPLSLAISVI